MLLQESGIATAAKHVIAFPIILFRFILQKYWSLMDCTFKNFSLL